MVRLFSTGTVLAAAMLGSVASKATAQDLGSIAFIDQIASSATPITALIEYPVIEQARTIPVLPSSTTGNLASVLQQGSFNYGIVTQTGRRNVGLIQQIGIANTASITQVGVGNRGLIAQQGRNNTAILVQR